MNNFNIDGIGRFGLIYNNTRWYAGASAIVRTFNYRQDRFAANNILGEVCLYVGYNFGLRSQYKKKKQDEKIYHRNHGRLDGSLGSSAQVTYTRADSLTICQLLRQAPNKPLPFGLPVSFTAFPMWPIRLEVNDSEQLVVNTRELDCTTLVETVTALTLCVKQEKRQWTDYLQMLRTLRYRQGVLDGYTSRLHYFTDWILDKQQMGWVEEIQQPNPPFTAVQRINVDFMSQHPQYYKALKADPAADACHSSTGTGSDGKDVPLYPQTRGKEYQVDAPNHQGWRHHCHYLQ